MRKPGRKGFLNLRTALIAVAAVAIAVGLVISQRRVDNDSPEIDHGGRAELRVFGHSVALGLGASAPKFVLSARLSELLDMPAENFGVGEAVLAWQNGGYGSGGYQEVLQRVDGEDAAGAEREQRDSYVLFYGFADIAQLAPGEYGPFEEALRTIVSRTRSDLVSEAESAVNVSLEGSGWTEHECSGACSGSSFEQSAADGDSFVVDVPADFAGGTIAVGLIANPDGAGGRVDFSVDGKPAGSLDTRKANAPDHYTGLVKRFTGLAPGSHEIAGVIGDADGPVDFDYWQAESKTPPLVVVPQAYRPASYASFDNPAFQIQPTDADVAALNAGIRRVAGEFDSSVLTPETDTATERDPANFFPDGLHPNDRGYERLASRIYESIQAAQAK